LHDEININLSVVSTLRHRIEKTLEPYNPEPRLGLDFEDRQALFEKLDTTVFDNMKNTGNLYLLGPMREYIMMSYNLVKTYNGSQCYQENHPRLLAKINSQLQFSQKNLEKTYRFLPRYSKNTRHRVSDVIKEETTESTLK
jgi:hypothetical protein